MRTYKVLTAGKPLEEAKKVLIMIHGRGGSAEDILSLAEYLNVKEYALLALQAKGNSWYPYSFLASPAQNEPWLSLALDDLKALTADVEALGILPEQVYFLGFSQGACLTLEFVTRNARRYGGVVAFTGGLIGDRVYTERYAGDFAGTPVFIGTGDPDPHVPLERVMESKKILEGMNAELTVKVYKGRGHTISQDELNEANRLILS